MVYIIILLFFLLQTEHPGYDKSKLIVSLNQKCQDRKMVHSKEWRKGECELELEAVMSLDLANGVFHMTTIMTDDCTSSV